MQIFSGVVAAIGLKGIVMGLVLLWLILALVKRLVKLAVMAVIVLAVIYYFYPMVNSVLTAK